MVAKQFRFGRGNATFFSARDRMPRNKLTDHRSQRSFSSSYNMGFGAADIGDD